MFDACVLCIYIDIYTILIICSLQSMSTSADCVLLFSTHFSSQRRSLPAWLMLGPCRSSLPTSDNPVKNRSEHILYFNRVGETMNMTWWDLHRDFKLFNQFIQIWLNMTISQVSSSSFQELPWSTAGNSASTGLQPISARRPWVLQSGSLSF